MGLSKKQKMFVDEYVVDFNASAAARRAGYSERTAGSIGSENLQKPEIADAIRALIDERVMGRDEALVRLADQARGDVGPYLKPGFIRYELDIEQMRQDGTAAALAPYLIEDERGWTVDIGQMKRDGKAELIAPYMHPAPTQFHVDLEQMIADGKSHLIKKLGYDQNGNQRIELYDAQSALEKIGKALGLFTDLVDVRLSLSMTAEDLKQAEDELEGWRRGRDAGNDETD